jgi:hypothetical protein
MDLAKKHGRSNVLVPDLLIPEGAEISSRVVAHSSVLSSSPINT